MSDLDKIQQLKKRLAELEQRTASSWEQPILVVAQQALEAEIRQLGRRVARWERASCKAGTTRVA